MGRERSLDGWLFLASPIKQRASGLGATWLLRALTSSPASQPSWPFIALILGVSPPRSTRTGPMFHPGFALRRRESSRLAGTWCVVLLLWKHSWAGNNPALARTRTLRCLKLTLVAAGPPGAWLPSLISRDFSKAMSGSSLINFTPATDHSDLWKDGQLQSQPEEPEPTLDGAAARAFYEALIEDESSTPETQRAQPGPGSERKRKKRRMMRETAAGASGGHGQRRPLEAKDKMTQQILRAAQEGDLAKLKRLLDPHEAGGAGGNINARDAFWWTPLMCAARAGQGEAVRYLLGRGAAWVGVCELGGRDAAQLAEEAGFPEVARMVRESPGERRSPENRSRPPSPQYCETCDAHFQDSNHCTSTAHLLSLSRDLRPPILPIGVPTSSPGFKLLLRGGWEPGMGLGPRGEGRANPIPTVLKRDQEGLGYRSAPQPRVTHFPARDTRAVAGRERAPRVTTLNRKEERRQEEKDKAWERDLRTYMNLEF